MKAKKGYLHQKGEYRVGNWLRRYLFKSTTRKKFSYSSPDEDKPEQTVGWGHDDIKEITAEDVRMIQIVKDYFKDEEDDE